MLAYTEGDTSRFPGSLAEYPDGHSGRDGIRGRAEGSPRRTCSGEYARPCRGGCDFGEYEIHYRENRVRFLNAPPKAAVALQSHRPFHGVLPFVYSITGIMLCAWWFYRRELWPPIQVLADATKHIREQDLDFMVDYRRNDELGRLCIAFEEMRQALYDNNRQLWNMTRQRRILQASVAHDLRNPIAIVEGYVEYMQQCLADGNLSDEELRHTLQNLAITAKRLEHYTDTIRDLNAIEETEIKYSVVRLSDFLRSAAESLSLLAKQHGLEMAFHSTSPNVR